MKAAIVETFGSRLAIETIPDPVLATGEVIVGNDETRVLSYAVEVVSGGRRYLPDLPVGPGPGALGRERASGPDVTKALYLGPHLLNTLRALGGAPAERKALGEQELVGGKLAQLRSVNKSA